MNVLKIGDMSIVCRRPYKSPDYLKFETDFKHLHLLYVIQWRISHNDRWNTEQFEFYTDFVGRVSWFRFHANSFKIRTYVKCISLKVLMFN